MDSKSLIDGINNSIKDILKLNPTNIIGVDIGFSSVKVAELKSSGDTYKLIHFAMVPLEEGTIVDDEILKEDVLLRALENAFSQAGIKKGVISFGVSGPKTLVKKLQLAGGSKEEIEDQVSWEIEQYVHFDIDESTISHHIVGENEGGGVDVIVAVAMNSLISNYKYLFEQLNFQVKIVDLDVIAIVNVLDHVLNDILGESRDSVMVLNLGAQRTQFLIYKYRMIIFSKDMGTAGSMITEEIQRQMGVNYTDAENLKTSPNMPEEVLNIITSSRNEFLEELKKTLAFYITATQDDSFSACYITGGGSLAPGLIESLESLLDLEVHVFNPFERLDYDAKRFSDEKITEIAYKGVSAIGLAMRSLPK